MKILVVQDSKADHSKVILTVNAGTSNENKNFKGASTIAASLVSDEMNNLNLSGYKCVTTLTSDYTNLDIQFDGNKHLQIVFSSISNAINYFPKDSSNIKSLSFKNLNINTYETNLTINEKHAANIIYGESSFRLGNTDYLSFDYSTFKKIEAYKKIFYCPSNSMLIVYGNYNHHDVYSIASKTLLSWKECSYNAAHTFAADFVRSSDFNAQITDFKNDSSELSLTLIQPSAYLIKSKREVLCGMLFSKLFEDPTSNVNQFLNDSLKLAKVSFIFNPSKYLSPSKFIFWFETLDSKRILSDYTNLKYLKDSLFYNNFNLQKAIIELKKQFNEKKGINSYLNDLAAYTSLTSLNYFCKINDSIDAVTSNDLLKFVDEYIVNNNFVSILSISESDYDSLQLDSLFVPTSSDISDYEFRFAKNTNLFQMQIGDSIVPYNYDSLLMSLAQWIKINPKFIVKINGVASDDELLTVRDDEMLNFFKENPSFKFAPESLIPTKKIRLDVYRSMTIVKRLVELGVPMKQLTGTGRLINKIQADKESGQRVFCNIKTL